MPFIAWIITLASTFENFFPYLVGAWQTPKGSVFLGTVHHPSDYFYYVSQFAQGTTRWFSTLDLYTSEPIRPALIGWSNVLLGRVFALFGISSFQSYQLAIILLTLALFFASFKLAKEILGSSRLATISLYLFSLHHAFSLTRDGNPSYGDYFNNFAVPRVRFGAVPHQLLLATASIYLTFFVLHWFTSIKNRSTKHLLGIVISSATLASLQPALWATIMGVFLLSAVIYKLSQKDIHGLLNTFIFPIFIAGISGILPVFYLSNLFSSPPFIQLKIWEASQQTNFTFGHFISATGPIFLLAISSLPWFLKKPNYSKTYVVLFAITSFTLFLSPIPALLELSHVRFMSTLAILCVCVITSFGIEKFSATSLTYIQKIFWGKHLAGSGKISLLLLVILSLYLLPNHLISIRLASEFDPSNAYHYISLSDYQFLKNAAKDAKISDTYLVIWPYNVIFPAISGKRSFHGHSLLTINSIQKDAQAVQFFDNKMSVSEAQIFLRDNHISYVLAYSWTTLPKGLMIHKATSGSLSLFAVNQEYLKPYSK